MEDEFPTVRRRLDSVYYSPGSSYFFRMLIHFEVNLPDSRARPSMFHSLP